MTFIVRLIDQGTCYGPFDDEGVATQFADYLTTEVDPAEVIKLCDPVRDLLGFYQQFIVAGRAT